MGMFDKLKSVVSAVKEFERKLDEFNGNNNQNINRVDVPVDQEETDEILVNQMNIGLSLDAPSRKIEEEVYGLNDKSYVLTMQLNNLFKETESHSEIEMLYTYNRDEEYGVEGEFPCVCIDSEDCFLGAIEKFEHGNGADEVMDLVQLDGQYLFKAKIEYYKKYIAYFYAMDSEIFDKAALCIIYPKEYIGSETEAKLMNVLDEAASTMKLLEA